MTRFFSFRINLFLYLGLSSISPSALFGADPTWWHQGSTAILIPGGTENNLGVANCGQAKWVAYNALQVINSIDPALAAQISSDLVGSGKPITSWAAPTTSEGFEAQQAPLSLQSAVNAA